MSGISNPGTHVLPGVSRPQDYEQLPRFLAILACSAGALFGAAGVTEGALFAAPSLLKYSLTVVAPVAGLFLLTMRGPLRLAVALLIVSIPFGGAKATLGGEQVSLLTVMAALSVIVAVLSGPSPTSISNVGAAAIAALALLAGPLIIGSDSGGAVLVGAMVLVGWLVSRVAREGEESVLIVYWAVVAAALIQAVMALYEFKTNHHVNLYGSAGSAVTETGYFGTGAGHVGELHSTHRPTGTLYDPISLGNVLAVSCPVIVVLAGRVRSLLARLVLAGTGVVVVLGLVLTYSRFSWIGAAAGTLIACLTLPSPRERIGTLAALVAVLALATSLSLATAGPSLLSRVESIANPTEASNRFTAKGDREREATWGDALTIFLNHPIAGVGFNQINHSLAQYLPNVGEGTNAQNTYLQVAAEGGLLGLAALLLIIGSTGRAIAVALRRNRALTAAVLGSSVTILVVWLTDVTVRYTNVAAFLAIVIGLASGLARTPSIESTVSSSGTSGTGHSTLTADLSR
jgi:O-antigen ligase